MQYMIPTLTELVTSFNDRDGDITLTYTDVVDALGYVPGAGSSPGGPGYSIQFNDNAGNFDGADFISTDGQRLYFHNMFGSPGGPRQGQIYADNANRLYIGGMDNGSGFPHGSIEMWGSTGTVDHGGSVMVTGGDSNSAGGDGGRLELRGGRSYGSSGNGGNAEIYSGTSVGGAPGHVRLWGADSSTMTGGEIILTPGLNAGGTTRSNIVLNGPVEVNASVGTNGKVLTSAGSGVAPNWKTPVETFTLATLPTALYAGQQIFVSDATGASFTGSLCWANAGGAWIDFTTNTVVV